MRASFSHPIYQIIIRFKGKRHPNRSVTFPAWTKLETSNYTPKINSQDLCTHNIITVDYLSEVSCRRPMQITLPRTIIVFARTTLFAIIAFFAEQRHESSTPTPATLTTVKFYPLVYKFGMRPENLPLKLIMGANNWDRVCINFANFRNLTFAISHGLATYSRRGVARINKVAIVSRYG